MSIVMVYHLEYPALHAGAHRKPPAKLGAPGLCRQVSYWIPLDPDALDGGIDKQHPVKDKDGKIVPFKARRDRWIYFVDTFLWNVVKRISEIDPEFEKEVAGRVFNHYGRQNMYLFNSTLIGGDKGWRRHPIFERKGGKVEAINGIDYDDAVDLLREEIPNRFENVTFIFLWHELSVTVQASLHSEYFALGVYIDLSHGHIKTGAPAPNPKPTSNLAHSIEDALLTINSVCNGRYDEIETRRKWIAAEADGVETAVRRDDPQWKQKTADARQSLRESHTFLYDEIWAQFETEILDPAYALDRKDQDLRSRIGFRFYDGRGVILHCPRSVKDVFCTRPFDAKARAPLNETIALGDHFNHTTSVNHADAVLPFLSSGDPYEDSRIEYTVSRFLNRRVIYMSSLAAESLGSVNSKAPIKFLILSRPTHRWQIGRFTERLFSMGTVRVAAVMNLEILNQAGFELRELSRRVQEVVAMPPGTLDPGSLSNRLLEFTSETAQLGATCDGGIEYRIERSRYYFQQYREIFADFRVEMVEGFQRYDIYVRRKLYSSYDYIHRLGVRLERHKLGLQSLAQAVQIQQHLAGNESMKQINQKMEDIDGKGVDVQRSALELQIFGEVFLIAPLTYYIGYVLHQMAEELGRVGILSEWLDRTLKGWAYVGAFAVCFGMLVPMAFRHYRKLKRGQS